MTHATRFNFSAGPAMLPKAVIEQARTELADFEGTGVGVMELSHRGAEFTEFAATSEARLRALLSIPDEFAVLYLQGGASQQFALAPMNLAARGTPGYVVSGHWGQKALKQARRVTDVHLVASSEAQGFSELPADWQEDEDLGWIHFTSNETIHGVQYHRDPPSRHLLVADMSSDFLSRPVDFSRYGMIYAGAQKNAGIAGLTYLIVRRDWLADIGGDLPDMLNYRVLAASSSMLNTPPTLAWYFSDLVLKWLQQQGGVGAMAERNREQANAIYALLDQDDFYRTTVNGDCRSVMNVVFQLADERLQPELLQAADEAGLRGLRGHRAVGGLRASIYNAMPPEGIQALLELLGGFRQRHG